MYKHRRKSKKKTSRKMQSSWSLKIPWNLLSRQPRWHNKNTLSKTLEKIKIKNSLLRQKKHNLIKKRNLMKLGIAWILNHVLQSIPLSPKQLEKLEKERYKAFWAIEDNQTVNKGHTKVSKHRINDKWPNRDRTFKFNIRNYHIEQSNIWSK